MVKVKGCGRIDDHPEHVWEGREEVPYLMASTVPKKVQYLCKPVVKEGGWRGVPK